MSARTLLLFALMARVLPGGWGLFSAGLAAVSGAGLPAVAGLALLALAQPGTALGSRAPHPPGPLLEAPDGPSEGREGGVQALELRGRWRAPPGESPHLQTAGGAVSLRLAADVRPPQAGTPLTVWARVDAMGRATAVHLQDLAPAEGAWLDRWRETAARRIRTLTHGQRGLVEALLLGSRDHLSPEVRNDCIRTGTMHLLALSGLHVALVAAALQRLPGLGRVRLLCSLGTLLSFVLLAGHRPSLLRASLAWLATFVGLASGRLGAGLPRLAAIALVLLTLSPTLREDLGAQLSFLAVAGLLAAARLLRGGLLGPSGAFLATAPLCLETFGRVQPWGLLITPFLVPAVAAVLLTGLLAVFPGETLSLLDPVTSPLLNAAADGLAWQLRAAAWLCPAPLTPPPFPLPGLWVSLLVVAALVALPGRGRRSPLEQTEAQVAPSAPWPDERQLLHP